MSRNKIDIATLAEMATAISHYGCLANCFSQLDPAQRATLEPAWKKACSGSKDGKYMDYQSNAIWQDINFHLVKQMWGSTACGWGGMGGSAVIHHNYRKCRKRTCICLLWWHPCLCC